MARKICVKLILELRESGLSVNLNIPRSVEPGVRRMRATIPF